MKTNYYNLVCQTKSTGTISTFVSSPETIEILNQTKSLESKKHTFNIAQFASMLVGFILFCFLILQNVSFGQVSTYTFAQTAGTYTAVTGTSAHVSGTDDAATLSVALGFTFVMNGTSYTTCTVNSNGYIVFGAAGLTNIYTPISTLTGANVISPFGRDLVIKANGVVYTTTGVSPNRVFTVQYHANRYTFTEDLNFQIKLYETTNVIQVVYGSTSTSSTTADNSIQIGLRGTAVSDYNNRSLAAAANWNTAVAGGANSSTVRFRNTAAPTTGLTWTWTPPIPACPTTPSPATAATGVLQTASLSWAAVTGATGYDVYLNTFTPPTTLVSSNQSGTSYTPSLLSANTLYYWRVVPRNAYGNVGSGCTIWSLTTQAAVPTVNFTALTGFGNGCVGSTNGPNTFTVSGINLTSSVDIAAFSGYSYCLTAGGTYTSTLSIPASGTLAATTVYVKFSPIAGTTYNGNIVLSSTGATSQNVAVSGTGIAPPVLNPITGSTTLCIGATSTLGGNTPSYGVQSFTTVGTSSFTPPYSGTAEALVVAGGGAGGTNRGGGGGAGGVIYNTAVAVTAGTPISVTVGAGGIGSATAGSGTNGGNSIFGAITATGGGRGGSHITSNTGANGGSGGGAGINYSSSSLWAGGTASPAGQGFAGGSSGPAATDNPRSTGGGGGAGGAGVSPGASVATPSNGGVGISNSITGSAVFYGGGGGGANGNASGETFTTAGAGAGGNGGGGNGAPLAGNPTSGAANTGGGGGGGGSGGSSTSIGGNGGSGVVIVKFPNFAWTSSNTSVATINPVTGVVTALTPGTTTITYTASTSGCSSSVNTIVTVNSADIVTATSSVSGNLCLGSSANIGVMQTGSNGNVYTFTWTMTSYTNSGLGGSTSATLGTPISVTPTAVGTYVYTINASSVGCSPTSSVTINVINTGAGVVLTPSATPSTVCAGSTTSLDVVFGTASNPVYTAPTAVTNPVADEDLGNVTITQGATTIVNNTSPINSLNGSIGTASGTAGSYSNFTAFGPYVMNPGLTYNLSLSSLTTGTTYQNAMAIYIDYNRNGVFTDAGEAVFVEGATVLGAHTVTGSFSVPTGIYGLTRMRVVSNEGLVTSPTMTVAYGEFEEYMLYFQPAGTITYAWSTGAATKATTATVSTNTTYTATVGIGGCPVSANVSVIAIPALIAPTATNSTQCGPGIPTASVAGNNAQTIPNLNWFDASTGGTNVNPSTYSGAINVTHYNNNFSSGLTSGTVTGVIAGTAALNANAMRITPPATLSQIGGFTVPGTGLDSDGHKISFSLTTSAANAADGMSINFGDDVPSTSGTAEQGSGTKLSVCFDTYDATGPTSEGVRVKYGGVELGFSSNVAWRGSTVPVVIDISNAGLVTVTVSGVALLSNVALPASYLSANKAAWTFGFLARSGGIAGEHTIDDVLIQYASLVSATTFPNSISAATTWYVSETVSVCTSARTSVSVAYSAALPATPGTISGTAIQCPALSSQTYSISAISGANSYTWTVPAGWTITSGTTTTSITVTTGASAQNGNITVTATNFCGTTPASTLPVTVASIPACISTFTPADGATNQSAIGVVLSWSAVPEATAYDVYVDGILVSSDQIGTSYTLSSVTISTTYSWKVVPKNCAGAPAGCSTYSFTTASSTCTPPSFTLTPTNILCFGGTTGSIAISASSGVSPYFYSKDNGLTYVTATTFSGLSQGSYNIIVKGTDDCVSLPTLVTLTQPTAAVSVTASGGTAGCNGAVVPLTGSASGGTGTLIYSWTPTTGLSNPAIASPSLTITGTQAYVLQVTDANSCSANATAVNITSNTPAAPTATATPALICVGQSTNLNAVSTGNLNSWWDSPTGGTQLANNLASGTNYSVSPLANTTYYVESYTATVGTPTTQTFNFSGANQSWTVPAGVSSIVIDARGAQGGSVSFGTGGFGGRTQGTLAVTPGQILNFFVGGTSTNSTGGYNGGGNGGDATNGRGGGGASDIRIGGIALTNRVFVAGGGGGGGNNCSTANQHNGGAGGGLTGGSGFQCGNQLDYIGGGGTQIGGGTANSTVGPFGTVGLSGIGGSGTVTYGGGGGGGYFGGGGGAYGGGGGGSSFSGSATSVTNTQGFQTGDGQISISYTPVIVGCISTARTAVTVTVGAYPTITLQPTTPAAICGSGTVTVSVTATSATSYQWLKGGIPLVNGSTYSNVNSNTMTITNPALSENGASLTCVVTGGSTCTVTSNAVTLSVNSTPANATSVTATSSSICVGETAQLSAVSVGNSINWWSASTGGTLITSGVASGANFGVSPISTTTYYAESTTSLTIAGSQTFNYSGAITTWTVPAGVSSINVTARGAQGGSNGGVGGQGAIITGTLAVTPGQVLSLLVGQQPTGTGSYSAGGGGSFVALGSTAATATPLLVAGGGGGAASGLGGDASITTSGNGPLAGTLGNGAAAASCGGGGGGFFTAGSNDALVSPTIAIGGAGFRQGGAGGTFAGYQSGGFGGGATANYYGACNMQGGAGGGYSGGSGQNSGSFLASGFGGGSFNSGTSQSNTVGNTGNGQIVISYNAVIPLCPASARVPVTVNVNTLPTISTQPAATTQQVCLNAIPVDLSVSATAGSGAIAAYEWYSNTTASNVGGTLVATNASSSLTNTYTPLTTTMGTLYYYVIVVNSNGCRFTSAVSGGVTINPIPSAVTAASSVGTICNGATVDLTSSATSNFSSLQTLLSPTGDGGFETGNTFALNGWTSASVTNNLWYIGTAVVNSGTRSALISNNASAGTAANYNKGNARINHLYKDVVIPAGATNITLSFNWQGVGEVISTTYYDYLSVSMVPTSTTPVAAAALSTGILATNLNNQATWQFLSIPISSAVAGTTQRFVFTWQNDASGGTDPGGVIDNVSVTANVPQANTYAWTASPVGYTSAVQNPTGVAPTVNTTYTVEATNGFNCKATNTVAVVVNQKPSSTITSTSTNVCYGNDFALTGNITASGAWTMSLSPSGTVTGTGSGTWTSTVAPTATTSYSVTNIVDALGCPVGTMTGSTILTLPIPTAALSPTDNATCVVKGSNWTHFYTSAGKLVVSIKGNSPTADFGSVSANSFVNTDAQVTTACVDPAGTTFHTAVLGRNWYINPTNNLPATIRLPITNAEVTALIAKSATTTFNPNDDVFSIANINLSKYNGLNENGSWQDNCNPADSSSYATSNLYLNQVGNGAISIANGFIETIAGSSYIEFTIPGFSEFWLMNSGNASPLPVQLTSFAANCNEKSQVDVKWTTASEQNSQYFILERSRDLSQWEYVSTVNAAGNSNYSINYATVDIDPFGGTSYYRLVQADFNGAESIYGPISVSCAEESNGMIVYPNPTKGNFTVEIITDENLSDSQLVITDLSGKVISTRNISIMQGKTQAIFENQELQLGTYIIQLNSSNHNIQPVRVVVN